MKKRSGHYRITLMVIAAMLLLTVSNASATQLQEQINGILYINTLDGAIYAWNSRSPNASLIVDYDYQFDKPTGWSSVAFSNDGRHVAYIRKDGSKSWVGISALDKWQPIEFAIDVHFNYEKVYLNWFPNNKQIVVSYLIDIPKGPGQPAMYNTLVGRQLLDTTTPSSGLINWPYNCAEIVVSSSEGQPMLQCDLNNHLMGKDEKLPATVWYDFIREGIFQSSDSKLALSFPVPDFIYPNWVWSEQSGLASFDNGSHKLPNGVNLLSLGSTQPLHLETPTTLFGTILWSPDGTRLLVQDNDLRIWHIYDISIKQASASLDIPNLNFQSGVIWFQDSDHIAYVTQVDQKSTIHIVSLASGEDTTLVVNASVTVIAASAPEISG